MNTLAKKYTSFGLRLAMVLGVAVALLASPQVATAQQVNESTNTLKISPVRRDVEIKPGETKTLDVTVTNVTGTAITVRAIENDFVAGDENGTPALILDENEYAPARSLKRFMKPISNVTIPAREAKTVKVVVQMPKDAKPGGYFGAIRFAPVSPDGGGQVNLNTSVASLMLVTVPGDVLEKLTLTDFDVRHDGKASEFFGSPDNLQLSARFQNSGGLQEGPFGKVSVLQGDKVIYETDFNNKNPRDVVLPEGARRWDIPLKNIGSFGYYTVNATFTYGKDNKTIEATKSFWVVPQFAIILAVVGLLVLIGLIVGIWLFLRNYKRKILRSQSGNGLRVKR